MSQFRDDKAREDKSDESGRKRSFGTPSRTFGSPNKLFKKEPKLRGPTSVLIKVASLESGVVELVFPKNAEDLREDIKQNLRVGGIKVCHWHPGAGIWSNMERNSKPQQPVLNCSPTDFILDESEFASEWKIMNENREYLDLATALELEFKLPVEEKEEVEVEATADDIQRDIRVLHRIMCMIANKAGITQEELDAAENSD